MGKYRATGLEEVIGTLLIVVFFKVYAWWIGWSDKRRK